MNGGTPVSISWPGADGLVLSGFDYRADSAEQGLPVICIPGLTRNARDFEEVAPWLARMGRRVIAVDLRGRGRSQYDSNPRRYRPSVYADDIRRLLAAQGIERAYILGTSLGGVIAMMLALSALPRIAGAVLNDIGPEAGAAGLSRIAGYVGKSAPVVTWSDAAAYAQRINGAAFPNFGEEDWVRFARRTFREAADGTPTLDYDPRISRPLSSSALQLATMLLWRGFKQLAHNRPTLVLRGALSDLLEPRTLQRMKQAAPTLLSCEVPGVGHAPALGEPGSREALAAYFRLVA